MLQKPGQKLNNQSGSTLLEAVVSLLLFTLVMTMVVSSFSTSGVISMRVQDLDNASNEAMRKIERATYESSGKKKDIELAFDGISATVPVRLIGETNDGVTFWKFSVETPDPRGGGTK